MSISSDDVRHIATLARVGLDDQRIPAIVEQLNGILKHMEVLQSVALPDDIHEVQFGMPLRPDVRDATQLAHSRESFAPAMQDGFFLVPRLSTHTNSGTSASASANEDDS